MTGDVRKALRLAAIGLAWVLLFLAAMTGVAACQPDDDGVSPTDCGELDQPRQCEGQS